MVGRSNNKQLTLPIGTGYQITPTAPTGAVGEVKRLCEADPSGQPITKNEMCIRDRLKGFTNPLHPPVESAGALLPFILVISAICERPQ